MAAGLIATATLFKPAAKPFANPNFEEGTNCAINIVMAGEKT